MAKIVIYDASRLDEHQITPVLQPTDHRWEYVTEKISIDNLHRDAEVISVFVNSTVTREMIEAMPSLRLIACRSTGFNNVDLQAAAERNVTIVNVPTYGESTVAEYAFTLLLALIRKLPQTLEDTVSAEAITGHDLNGKTLGVIGTGHIGCKTIGIAKGFEMKVIAYDPYPNDEAAKRLDFEYVGLDTLLEQADAITLHAPYNDATHHLLGRDQFAAMKSSAILINTARGELINTGDLVSALNNNELAGAALDVVEGEALLHHEEELALLRSHQIPEDLMRHSMEISSLKKMPNVIITPHNAFNTIEAIGRINQITAQNIIDFWYGHVPNEVQAKATQQGRLLLVRHAESEWNATGQWTGITNVHLSEKGFHEAALLGIALKGMNRKIDIAYCSEQIRTRETLEGMLSAAQMFNVTVEKNAAINERDYGEYTGKNKWEMRDLLGEEKFNKLRRGWNEPVPGGETLKTVYERAVPFYKDVIVPQVLAGKTVLLVGHGNSIRSLMKYIEDIDDVGIEDLNMLFGEILDYEIDDEGRQKSKSVTRIDTTPPNA